MNATDYQTLRDAAMERLFELDRRGEPLVGHGVSIVTKKGWVSGLPYLFSTDYSRAFAFADEGSACVFIYEFGDLLDQPRVVERSAE